MGLSSLKAYVEAGLDENLAKFVKGVVAASIIGGVVYAGHHLSIAGFAALQALQILLGGVFTVGLVRFWSWAKTTAESYVEPAQG